MRDRASLPYYEKKFYSDGPEKKYLQTETLGNLALVCQVHSHDSLLDRPLHEGEVVVVLYRGKSNVDFRGI